MMFNVLLFLAGLASSFLLIYCIDVLAPEGYDFGSIIKAGAFVAAIALPLAAFKIGTPILDRLRRERRTRQHGGSSMEGGL
jgi:hypothetical protein